MTISARAKVLCKSISEKEDADIYLWNGPINEDGFGALVGSAGSVARPNAILFLTTYGGSANSAYRIARYFQSVYTRFTVVVPGYCKSAGTLVTLGAHRLIMTEFAELGPLDVQLAKRDELGERRSGLLLRSALTHLNEHTTKLFGEMMMSIKMSSGGLIRFKLASELAAKVTKGLMSQVYCQITAETLGQDHQDLMVAMEYGKRLAEVGGLIGEDQIYDLVHNYPSHDFVIDVREARKLFINIDAATQEMYEMLAALGPLAWQTDPRRVTVLPLSERDETNEDQVDVKGKSEGGDPKAEAAE